MTTTVQIPLEMRPNVLVVPIRAVRRSGDQTFVLLRRGDTIERRLVTTAIRDDTYWEISEGLREGDEVLVGDVATEEVIE
jgi:multidrug efflux pump subunit AcrA (membrane-fusion protein)